MNAGVVMGAARRALASRQVLLVLTLTVLCAPAGAVPALAATTCEQCRPWWHLSSTTAPGNLPSTPPIEEVQDVAVSATGGEFILWEPVAAANGEVVNGKGELRLASFSATATGAEVQSGLEGIYGAGNVTVTGGPGDASASKPYVVTFTGRLAGPEQPMVALPFGFGGGLTGGSGTATVTEATKGQAGQIIVTAANLGDIPVTRETTITDTLPAGVTVQGVSLYTPTQERNLDLRHFCALPQANVVECKVPFSDAISPAGPNASGEERPAGYSAQGPLPSYKQLELDITVNAQSESGPGTVNEVAITGGGAAGASLSRQLTISDAPTPFGVADYELSPENPDGTPDLQAGSHPFQLTTTLMLNRAAESVKAPALVKDLDLDLPPGLVGNATAFPQCGEAEFRKEVQTCAPETQLGIAWADINRPTAGNLTGTETWGSLFPVYNLKPSPGEPARFGFVAVGTSVIIDTALRTGGDYGAIVSVKNISQVPVLLASRVTLWGVPGDPRHDHDRVGCLAEGGACPSEPQKPFLTLPTTCTGTSLQTTVAADSWQSPGAFSTFPTSEPMPALEGCNRLLFNPSIDLAPDGGAASTPMGLTVGVHVPQDVTSDPNAMAESTVRDTTVTLPEGMQVNPASADGLEACSTTQVGFTGVAAGVDQFTPDAAACPDGSKVGNVEEIKTPLLANPLKGSVYLAAQNANPFGSLIALYLIAEDPVSGVRVKLAGDVSLNPETGQLTSTFENTPQLLFEDLKLHFFGGPRAPLSTPPGCGTYTTTASFTPWSGNAPAGSQSSFTIDTGPGGSPCADPQPFSPSLTAGSTDIQAGAFSPFTATISREDGNQNLARVQLSLPEGLLGRLAAVVPCPEPQASLGTCGPQSLVGHTVVSVGLGSDPYTIAGGQVFITGPYEGASYGLSIAEPAKAGPFDLGSGPCDCVVVRAKIEVDPHTSALTVVSDPLPTMLQGIPLQVKHVKAIADRAGFTFNPTNCGRLAIAGTLSGEQGASAAMSVPFQVANCASLPFKPTFTVSTQAKTSKAGGAGLHVRVTSAFGQANIGKTRVILPEQLPSRLTTLQKACPDTVFDANPASCPAASVVGTAIAHTPVLNNPLTGPAYLVSHGGAAFPDLVIVLQGEGVVLYLDGNTNIKKGITSSTFNSVPDAPVSAFELTLPEGPHSVLATNLPAKAKGSMCGQKLSMPTTMTAQNGAVLTQATKIAVSGCPRHGAKQAKAASRRHLRGGTTKK